MNILGLEWIDFVVFSLMDFHVERINVDNQLWTSRMLPRLTEFYVDFILPNI